MYPITISFTVSTPTELDRLTAAATNIQRGLEAPASEKPATEPAKQEAFDPNSDKTQSIPREVLDEAIATAKKQQAAAKSAPPADTAPATPATTAAASGELDYEKDVKPAFLKLVQSKGRASGRKIIDAFAPTKEKLSEAITTQEQFKQALALIQKEAA